MTSAFSLIFSSLTLQVSFFFFFSFILRLWTHTIENDIMAVIYIAPLQKFWYCNKWYLIGWLCIFERNYQGSTSLYVVFFYTLLMVGFFFLFLARFLSLQWVSNSPLWTFAECLVAYSKWGVLWVLSFLHAYLDSLHGSEFHSPWKVSLKKTREKVRQNHCFLLEEFAFLSVISVHYLIYLNFVLFPLQEFTQ